MYAGAFDLIGLVGTLLDQRLRSATFLVQGVGPGHALSFNSQELYLATDILSW